MHAIKKDLRFRVAESVEDPMLEHFRWFLETFPTDEDCLEALLSAAQINITDCHHCAGKIRREYGARTGTCNSCRRVTYVTAGTFFDHMRRPRVWWCIIVTLASKLPISIKSINSFLGGSYFTVWRNVHNVAMAIEQQMTDLTLATTSGSFLPAICRRSKETSRRSHPRTEEQEAQGEQVRQRPETATPVAPGPSPRNRVANASPEPTLIHGAQLANSSTDNSPISASAASANPSLPETSVGTNAMRHIEADNSDLESAVIESLAASGPSGFELLSVRTTIDAPRLSATLTLMQIAGTVVRLGGDQFMLAVGVAPATNTPIVTSCCPAHRDDALALIERVIEHLKTVHRGISRKYLQRYVCLYWCLTSNRWTLENILNACMNIGEVEGQEIVDYVSPLSINVLACTESIDQSFR